jgi:SatD family protein
MAIVVTLDQRRSRGSSDRVGPMARELNRALADDLALGFVRTAGDEMQGVVATGEGLAAVVDRCLEAGDWWIGIGIGRIDSPVGATARESRGSAFWHAREAVLLAHKQKGGAPGPAAVVGEPQRAVDDLAAALSALAFIVAGRTERQRQAIEAARGTQGLRAVAKRLDISVSAVSQLLRAAGYREQERLHGLVSRLAAEVA